MFEYKKWKKKSIERAADTNKKETYDTHFMITTDATVFRKNNSEQEKKTSENHKKTAKIQKKKMKNVRSINKLRSELKTIRYCHNSIRISLMC